MAAEGNLRGRPRRALVIGGSMSGLFAALLLRQQGFEVDVYERVEGELAGRGAGIVAQPEMRDVFKRLGHQSRAEPRRRDAEAPHLRSRRPPDR